MKRKKYYEFMLIYEILMWVYVSLFFGVLIWLSFNLLLVRNYI